MIALTRRLTAAVVAATFTVAAIMPASALTLRPVSPAGTESSVIKVQNSPLVRPGQLKKKRSTSKSRRVERRSQKRNWRKPSRRHDARGPRYDRRKPPIYRGHRGYRHKRHGYRYHNGYWYPLAAFAAGAIIGGAVADQNARAADRGDAHVQWCYDHYRSYRASDNTFQPYHGPRKPCVSPYY